MGMTLWEDNHVTGAEAYGWLGVHLHEALPFRDEMENHDSLRAGLKQRCCRVRARRLVAPGRAESTFDEYGAHKADDT